MGLKPKYNKSSTKADKKEEIETLEEADEEMVWSLKEIATNTEAVIYNSKEDKVYNLLEAVVEILNRTEE